MGFIGYALNAMFEPRSVIEPLNTNDDHILVSHRGGDVVNKSAIRFVPGYEVIMELVGEYDGKLMPALVKLDPNSPYLKGGILQEGGNKLFDPSRLEYGGKSLPINQFYYVRKGVKNYRTQIDNEIFNYYSQQTGKRLGSVDVSCSANLTFRVVDSERLIIQMHRSGQDIRTDDLIQASRHNIIYSIREAFNRFQNVPLSQVLNSSEHRYVAMNALRPAFEMYGVELLDISFDYSYNRAQLEKLEAYERDVNELSERIASTAAVMGGDATKAAKVTVAYKMASNNSVLGGGTGKLFDF